MVGIVLAAVTAWLPLQEGPSGEPEARSLDGPGVIRASVHLDVQAISPAKKGRITFPVPGTYREQVPLTFDVRTTPPEALLGVRWRLRKDGVNWLCEVDVAPSEAGSRVEWEALVLVADRSRRELPRVEKPEVTEAANRWLRATACVQSDNAKIVAQAQELQKGTRDVNAYVKRVFEFTSRLEFKQERFDALDAAKALECGGSCTSRANLAAALLRARGIPARTVAHLVTWYGPHYQHWLTEYWHPGVGWVWIEPTLGQEQPAPWTLVVLNVANPEDEDRAFDPRLDAMPGAPWNAVIDLSEELMGVPGSNPEENWAKGVTRISGTADEWKQLLVAANKAFERITKEGRSTRPHIDRVERSLLSGAAGKVRAVLD